MKHLKALLGNGRRAGRIILVTGALALVLAGLGGVYEVFLTPPGDLASEEIVRRVSQESPIFYADGHRQIGAFFAGAHRKYVRLKDIPLTARQAVVAAEDQNFYRHHGVDVLALGGAFLEGLTHLNFRRAGSTITQQTVKILFDDWEHSFRRKVQEALAAFKMERLYSKDQILEYYLNQFHVTSNGNGIGVAARYYFDKDVKDLDLVEAAFIAGTVKQPTKYNPYTKHSAQERDAATAAAKVRKDYVLRRMAAEGFIDQVTSTAAQARPVPFKRGDFQSGDVTLVELVRGQLTRPDVLAAIGMDDAADLDHAGLRIITTLDADIQAAAETAVRRNLVRLEILLKGYAPEAAAHFRPLGDLKVGEFAYGRVVAAAADGSEPELKVSFGGPTGTIGAESLRAVAALLAQASGKPAASHLKGVLRQLTPGAVVFVRVEAYDAAARTAALELARRPTVNGGLIVLDAGDVRAAVPGFDAQGYDRALAAQRQPGSVFKAIVFHAALQLGWSILDQLSNVRRVFSLNGRLYIPRGDHESRYDQVSMLWTGIESENIAAVWLTAHLLDKLSFAQFTAVLANLDLAPDAGESADEYQRRVARLLGIRTATDGFEERQLELVAAASLRDAAAGDGLSARRLRSLWWGRGYEAELGRALARGRRGAAGGDRDTRVALVANNVLRLQALALRARSDWTTLALAVQKYGASVANTQPALRAILTRFVLVPGPDDRSDIAYLGDQAALSAAEGLVTRPFGEADVDRVFDAKVTSFFGLGPRVDDVRLDGGIKVAQLEALRSQVEAGAAAARAEAATDDTGVRWLYHSHDAREAIALRYLVSFTQAMGVTSTLRPVLSFALGTNVVTLAEVAKVYQTLLDGKVYRFHDGGPSSQLNVISRIEDAGGAVVYQAEKRSEQLVPPELSRPLLEILRRVVTNGTGRLLNRELELAAGGGAALKVPVYGKTGTTNGFTSGGFAGFLPHPHQGSRQLDPRVSYVIAAYAGFDRNEPMQHGHFKGYGADVAVPAWAELAKEIVRTKGYAGRLDALPSHAADAGEWPVAGRSRDTPVRVDLILGAVSNDRDDAGTTVVRVPGAAGLGGFVPSRALRLFKAAAVKPKTPSAAGG